MRKLLAKIILWALEIEIKQRRVRDRNGEWHQGNFGDQLNGNFKFIYQRISELEQAHIAASKPIKGRGRGHENRH